MRFMYGRKHGVGFVAGKRWEGDYLVMIYGFLSFVPKVMRAVMNII